MRIGIDLIHCHARRSGMQRYAIQTLRCLIPMDRENEYVLFCRGEVPPELLEFGCEAAVSTFGHQAWAEQFWLPFEATRRRVDVLHTTGSPGSLLHRGCTVLWVYDFTPWLYGHTLRAVPRAYWRRIMPGTARHASRIVVFSRSTLADVERVLKVSVSKAVLSSGAANAVFRPIPDASERRAFCDAHDLPDRYILALGTLEPRKNLVGLVEAYRLLMDRLEVTPKLLLVGRHGWLQGPLFERVTRLGLSSHILFRDSMDQEELALLFNCAEMLVYPSLYEGFGLPPLEAMQCGTPVVVSGVSSLPEVCGEAALYVDPYDPTTIAGAMEKLVSSSDLRSGLSARGIERSRQFTWDRVAADVISATNGAWGSWQDR